LLLQKITLEVTSGAKSAEEPAKAWVSQPEGVKSEAKGFWLPPDARYCVNQTLLPDVLSFG
jgi:hypothetical protein